jgi:hypothetical protein
VAVYPQASTGLTGQNATITTEVGIDSDEKFQLRDNQRITQQPSDPFHTNQWVGDVGAAYDCVNKGVGLPLGIGQAPEMPGPGPIEQRVSDLFGASIADASPQEGQA